jgi:genome maintenance exonuclease 1
MKTFRHLYNDLSLCDLPKEELNGKRFYITPEGNRLPSVTTFLSTFNKDHIHKWRKRVGDEEANRISTGASRRGTKFHKLMERALLNEDHKTITEGLMPDQKQSFIDMYSTLDRIDNIEYIETMLYSNVIGLAGQVDLIAEFDGIPSIIDWKTSSKLKKESWIENYFLQCTAYSLMYEDMTDRKNKQIVVIISVDGEPEPQIFIKQRRDYTRNLYEKLKEFRK